MTIGPLRRRRSSKNLTAMDLLTPSSTPPQRPGPMESAEGIGLHDALAALADSGTRLPMPQEMHILRSEVIEAAIALDRLAEPGFLPASPVARVLTNLDAEIFTVTTVAENVSAFLPDGEDHDAVVEIFEAGTRAAADVVRLRTVIVPGS